MSTHRNRCPCRPSHGCGMSVGQRCKCSPVYRVRRAPKRIMRSATSAKTSPPFDPEHIRARFGCNLFSLPLSSIRLLIKKNAQQVNTQNGEAQQGNIHRYMHACVQCLVGVESSKKINTGELGIYARRTQILGEFDVTVNERVREFMPRNAANAPCAFGEFCFQLLFIGRLLALGCRGAWKRRHVRRAFGSGRTAWPINKSLAIHEYLAYNQFGSHRTRQHWIAEKSIREHISFTRSAKKKHLRYSMPIGRRTQCDVCASTRVDQHRASSYIILYTYIIHLCCVCHVHRPIIIIIVATTKRIDWHHNKRRETTWHNTTSFRSRVQFIFM